MARSELTIDAFCVVVEMLFSHLRLKDADRWSEDVALLKFQSLAGAWPELSSQQLMWSAEMWIQSTAGKDFLKFPAWAELLAPLYRCDHQGLAVRAAGFRPDLPAGLAPTPQQLALLEGAPDPRRLPPPGADPAAYEVFQAPRPALPPAAGPATPTGLTPELWAQHLQRCKEQQQAYLQGVR